MIVTSVPAAYLLEEMREEVMDFKEWLVQIMDKDTDEDCMKRAAMVLTLFQEVVNEYEERSKNMQAKNSNQINYTF
jgi:hypothetical protein